MDHAGIPASTQHSLLPLVDVERLEETISATHGDLVPLRSGCHRNAQRSSIGLHALQMANAMVEVVQKDIPA